MSGERFGDNVRVPSLHDNVTAGGYSGPYSDDTHRWSEGRVVRTTLVSDEAYCVRGPASHGPPHDGFSWPHDRSSSPSRFEPSGVHATPHPGGTSQPLFPIVPVVVRPEVKVVQADRIFEQPGRRDRPSHVSHITSADGVGVLLVKTLGLFP